MDTRAEELGVYENSSSWKLAFVEEEFRKSDYNHDPQWLQRFIDDEFPQIYIKFDGRRDTEHVQIELQEVGDIWRERS